MQELDACFDLPLTEQDRVRIRDRKKYERTREAVLVRMREYYARNREEVLRKKRARPKEIRAYDPANNDRARERYARNKALGIPNHYDLHRDAILAKRKMKRIQRKLMGVPTYSSRKPPAA